jgi:hypothetical protein
MDGKWLILPFAIWFAELLNKITHFIQNKERISIND